MKNLSTLAGIDCIDELESRLNKMHGILSILEACLFNPDMFASMETDARYAVLGVADMTKECLEIKTRIHHLLHRN